MAKPADKEEIPVTDKEIQMEDQEIREEVVSVELPAPEGWKKKDLAGAGSAVDLSQLIDKTPTTKGLLSCASLELPLDLISINMQDGVRSLVTTTIFTPKKGGTPKRNEIVFISPTGDTPRRSARISEKSKATETPEREPPMKKERKSSSKKGAKEKKDCDDGEGEAVAATAEETKASADVEMKEAEDLGDKNKEEVATGEAGRIEDDTVKQEPVQKTEEKLDEASMEKLENPEASNKTATADTKEEHEENKSLPPPGGEENEQKVGEELPAESEAPLPPTMPNKEVSSEKAAKLVGETSPEKEVKAIGEVGEEANVGESLPDNGSLKESQGETKLKETHDLNCEETQPQPKASPPVSC
ncbi:hypothetical protein HHK36_019426 [Tetracentron sinense]|uniref:Uncharacterized protein n=1 Tax=Tetracentron sinense TaxID=13715 RepID=A0A834YW86_TETSI|nr:hypothetical protein HHK36_019426 [Tetracentron sinense]